VDINNNDTGDESIPDVLVSLVDSVNQVIKTTLTDTNGSYKFDNVKPGLYFVPKTNPSGFIDVSDIDGGDLNKIVVTITSEDFVGNNFVDEQSSLAQILGSVTNNDPDKVPLAGVVITLSKDGLDVATTITDATGWYTFVNLPAGNYTVEETNPVDYPLDVSGYDVIIDNDLTDRKPSDNKNVVKVSLWSGEVDDGNNFVDDLSMRTIIGNVKEDIDNNNLSDTNIAGFMNKSWMDLADLFVDSTMSNQPVLIAGSIIVSASWECVLAGVLFVNGHTRYTQTMTQGYSVRIFSFGLENPIFLMLMFLLCHLTCLTSGT
jgi:hypothetical protein